MADYYGTQGDDTIIGTGGDDFINGLGGDDVLYGMGGNDVLHGSDGADVLDGGAGDDILDATFTDGRVDVLTGGSGADLFRFSLYGYSSTLLAADRITDFSAAEGDRLHLGVYNNGLRWAGAVTNSAFNLTVGQSLGQGVAGFGSAWTWSGGGTTWLIIDTNGNDRLDNTDFVIAFTGTPALSREAFAPGAFTAASFGTSGNDAFTGGPGPDEYYGLGGDDTASGGGGDDQLFGGEGSDILVGGDGSDLLVGETGSDILRGGAGDDQLYAGMRYNSVSTDLGTFNELYGEEGNDVLVGAQGRDGLDGGVGDDTLDSRDDDSAHGGDILLGGDGNDIIRFNGDLVDGGAGDDILYFGEVGSTVTGGSGADRFDLIQTRYQGNYDRGHFHLITDFNAAEGDRLSLGLAGHYHPYKLMFRGKVDNPGFTFQPGQAFTSNHFGGDIAGIWTWAVDDVTLMIIDLDGDGVLSNADYVVAFSGRPVLNAASFVEGSVTGGTFGTDQADVIHGTDGSDTIYGLSGDDEIHAGAGNDYIYGNAGDDRLFGGDGSNYIYGGDGDDVLTGGAGYNVLHGGAGSDIIYGGPGGGELNAGGNLPGEAEATGGVDLIYGSDNADFITGGRGAHDQSFGFGGDDIINGAGRLEGGSGDDQLSSIGVLASAVLDGGVGNDTIVSGDFGDLLIGGAGADKLSGGGGDDEIRGAFGDYWINGDAGDDLLRISGHGSSGDATLYIRGGEGFDVADFSQVDGYLTLDLGAPGEQETGVGRVYIEGVEHIIGSAAGSHITGGQGADRLEGQAGADVLIGGAGDDILIGGRGDDRIDGGAGHDVLLVSGSASDYRLLLDGDDFILKGPDGSDRITGVELIRFGDGRALELNRMYGALTSDGVIPDHLLSPPTGPDGKRDDAFVLPPALDDTPISDAGKLFADPQVLPPVLPDIRVYPGLDVRLICVDDHMPVVDHHDWM